MAEQLTIMLGMPGPHMEFGSACGFFGASRVHQVRRLNSPDHLDNFSLLLVEALNARRRGEITHYAMQHADVAPAQGWLDALLEEMQAAQVSFISGTVPIRDSRGLLSCGVADPARGPWDIPFRRLTVRESLDLPPTFTAADLGYPGFCLLHNNGLILLDLRDERFFAEDADGLLCCTWNFPRRIARRADGSYGLTIVSEDWWVSWQIHRLGIPSAITRRIPTVHGRQVSVNNFEPWGTYLNGDEDTREKWHGSEAT